MQRKIPPEAFDFYLSLGPGRSYKAVAEKYGVTKKAVTNFAVQHDWQGRLEEIEPKARERGEERAIESLDEMSARHVRILRVIEAKTLEAIRSGELKAGIALRGLLAALREERELRSLPTNGNIEDSAHEHAEQNIALVQVANSQFDLDDEDESAETDVG